MIKRTLFALLAAVLSIVAMIGVEILLALRRTYLPTEPALEIGGVFGDPDAQPLRFVVMGDSTAAGVGVANAADAYPTLLAQRLAETGRRVELTGLGISGARVADVLEHQLPEAVELTPDLVFLGIGANDVTHVTSLSDVERDVADIVRTLESAGAIVVVAGAPDMRAAAWHEPLRSLAGWRGRAVSAAVERAGRAAGADVVPLARETGPFFAAHPEDAYGDDLFHPGKGGYQAWADAIYPVLEAALR